MKLADILEQIKSAEKKCAELQHHPLNSKGTTSHEQRRSTTSRPAG